MFLQLLEQNRGKWTLENLGEDLFLQTTYCIARYNKSQKGREIAIRYIGFDISHSPAKSRLILQIYTFVWTLLLVNCQYIQVYISSFTGAGDTPDAAVIRPFVRWNKCVMFYATSGNNGKGTLCEMLSDLSLIRGNSLNACTTKPKN